MSLESTHFRDLMEQRRQRSKRLATKPAEFDPVTKPAHYNTHPSGVECIQITRHMNFNLGNVYKYVWRAGLKNDNQIEDLEKAAFYLQDELKRLKGEH